MNERPKPPPPRPPSDPSLHAAGVTRPRAKTDPDMANRQLEDHELHRKFSDLEAKTGADQKATGRHVARLEQTLRENDEAQNAAIVIIARELGVADKLPARVRGSLPPPKLDARTSKPPKPPTPRMPKIEADTIKGKVAAYVAAAVLVAEGLWKVWTMIHGGK